MSELKPFDEFMDALVHCDTVKVILTGCGESTFETKPIYEGICALAYRRAQPANEPLTLDEMNALDHEPIYILHTGGKWAMNGWHIATASSYQNHGRCDLEIDNGNTIIDTQNYGKTWLAYAHKPGGEQDA